MVDDEDRPQVRPLRHFSQRPSNHIFFFFFGGGSCADATPDLELFTFHDERKPGLFFFCVYISVIDWLTDLVFSQWLLYYLEIPPFIRQTGKDIKCLRRNNMAFRTPRSEHLGRSETPQYRTSEWRNVSPGADIQPMEVGTRNYPAKGIE